MVYAAARRQTTPNGQSPPTAQATKRNVNSIGNPKQHGLQPLYQNYQRQKCFIAYSENAPWAEDLIAACSDVLESPAFKLEADYARKHFHPNVTLREKALELIANARYGIYDLSYWQDEEGKWQMPRNVFIELGMAIALNRPMLLLRHAGNEQANLQLPQSLESIQHRILTFSGYKALKTKLDDALTARGKEEPEVAWWNRYCHFGGRVCDYRETHPRSQQWGKKQLHCHIADGTDVDQSDFHAAIEDVLKRFDDITYGFLHQQPLAEGYDFLSCSHCQTMRSTPFAIYRLSASTSAETFITIGMSIAIEAQFGYKIPKMLLADRLQNVPSLLSGYEIVLARNYKERQRFLKKFVPSVLKKSRVTFWNPRRLPAQSSLHVSEDANLEKGELSFFFGRYNSLDDALIAVCQTAQKTFSADAVTLYTHDPEWDRIAPVPIKFGLQFPERTEMLPQVEENSIVQEMFSLEDPHVVPDVSTEPLFGHTRFVRDEEIRSCIALPIKGSHVAEGVIFINYRTLLSDLDTTATLTNLNRFSTEAGIIITEARRQERQNRLNMVTKIIDETIIKMNQSLHLDEMLYILAEKVAELFSYSGKEETHTSIWIMEQESSKIKLFAAHPPEIFSTIVEAIGSISFLLENPIGIVGRAARMGQHNVVSDVSQDPDYLLAFENTRSQLSVPILHNDKVIGIINVESPNFQAFNQSDAQSVEALAARIARKISEAYKFENEDSLADGGASRNYVRPKIVYSIGAPNDGEWRRERCEVGGTHEYKIQGNRGPVRERGERWFITLWECEKCGSKIEEWEGVD